MLIQSIHRFLETLIPACRFATYADCCNWVFKRPFQCPIRPTASWWWGTWWDQRIPWAGAPASLSVKWVFDPKPHCGDMKMVDKSFFKSTDGSFGSSFMCREENFIYEGLFQYGQMQPLPWWKKSNVTNFPPCSWLITQGTSILGLSVGFYFQQDCLTIKDPDDKVAIMSCSPWWQWLWVFFPYPQYLVYSQSHKQCSVVFIDRMIGYFSTISNTAVLQSPQKVLPLDKHFKLKALRNI